MKVKNLEMMYFERVVLYKSVVTETGIDYEDLYKGNVSNIPNEFLNYKVLIISAKAKGLLDICVESD